MSDAAAPAQTAKSPSKKKAASKTKKPATHPNYREMVVTAITDLKERSGSSRQAILKYIMAKYKLGDNATMVNARLKLALKAGTKAGVFKQSKGTGATGSFRVEKKAAAPKKVKKPAAKKPATKKPAAKKPAAKKPAAKKTAAKKPAAKKPAAKKPAAKKPAAKKPAAKKPAAKKPAKKPAAKKPAAKKPAKK